MLGNSFEASCKTGTPAIEARWVAGGAVTGNSMNDGTLSDASEKYVIFPRGCLL